jgi:hypothetical protein
VSGRVSSGPGWATGYGFVVVGSVTNAGSVVVVVVVGAMTGSVVLVLVERPEHDHPALGLRRAFADQHVAADEHVDAVVPARVPAVADGRVRVRAVAGRARAEAAGQRVGRGEQPGRDHRDRGEQPRERDEPTSHPTPPLVHVE